MELTINSTAVSSLDFRVLEHEGFISFPERKNISGSSDKLTSENPYSVNNKKQSSDISVKLLGNYDSLEEMETALFSLYGILAAAGEKTFTLTSGANSLTFKGTMNKGAVCEKFSSTSLIVIVVTLRLIKTND